MIFGNCREVAALASYQKAISIRNTVRLTIPFRLTLQNVWEGGGSRYNGLVCAMHRKFATGRIRPSADMMKVMKAKVIVMPKAAVLDPQGNAVRDAMRHLGMPEVRGVRIGKYMEIDIEGQNGDLESRLHRLCRDLLSNPVIEDYELQRTDVGRQKSEVRKKR
jgi:phosphoribosylformylglycinamidine synthase subunit PurS